MPRNHVQVRVCNRLAGRLTNINTDVVAIRYAVRLNATSDGWEKSPNGGLLFLGQSQEISLVPARNNQAMVFSQGESIAKCRCEVVSGNEIVCKSAGHKTHSRSSRSLRTRLAGIGHVVDLLAASVYRSSTLASAMGQSGRANDELPLLSQVHHPHFSDGNCSTRLAYPSTATPVPPGVSSTRMSRQAGGRLLQGRRRRRP